MKKSNTAYPYLYAKFKILKSLKQREENSSCLGLRKRGNVSQGVPSFSFARWVNSREHLTVVNIFYCMLKNFWEGRS